MYLPSASSLERVSLCVGSAVLPKVETVSPASDRGRAIHAFLARVVEVGREAALVEVPAAYAAHCSAIDLDKLPTSSLEVHAEVAFAYDPVTGVARELGRNIARAYSLARDEEFMGTADVVVVGADDLFIGDYKTGYGLVTSARENWQLKFLALAASKVFQRATVRVGVIRIPEDGAPTTDTANFDAVDLDQIAEDLRVLSTKVARAQELAFLGEAPPTATGAHCRYCKSLTYCPAQTALVRTLAGDTAVVADDILAQLTPKTAAVAWLRLKVVEEVVGRVREALYAYAREQPIPLPNGNVVGVVETKRRAIDGRVAFEVLQDAFGLDAASAAVELDTSMAAIERVLRIVSEQSGAKLASLKRQVWNELEDRNGITVKTFSTVREHREKTAAPEISRAA